VLVLKKLIKSLKLTKGTSTVVGQSNDGKSLSESWDDTTIKLGIKEKYFSYDATLFTKIDVEVELGKVLLTGVVPFGDMRLEAVRLAWQQNGVIEVLNEISIDTGYGLDDIAKDKCT
jgi:osmotically-inducible protein OsmY